jgi:hypothetical protein
METVSFPVSGKIPVMRLKQRFGGPKGLLKFAIWLALALVSLKVGVNLSDLPIP